MESLMATIYQEKETSANEMTNKRARLDLHKTVCFDLLLGKLRMMLLIFWLADNVAALRSWGIRIPSARPVNPIKKRNFYLTTMKLRH